MRYRTTSNELEIGAEGCVRSNNGRVAIQNGAVQLFETHGYGPCSMALKSHGAKIGICGLFKRYNLEDPDIGFSVLPEYCPQGYAGEAPRVIIDTARAELGLEALTAIVSPTNVPSIALIEKLGMKFERMITMPGDDQAICLYRI